MKHGFVSGLGHRPSGGAGEGGLPADSGNAENAFCFDRYRQRVWAGGTDYYVGKLMPLGPEVKALQLRPDGLRGARAVRLVFRPTERHQKAYGPVSILARGGEIIPVPWCKDEIGGNGCVEVYPCFQATVDITTPQEGHYARFALIEDDADKKDAIRYQPDDSAKFSQSESFAAAADTKDTDKLVPGLISVPCEGMRAACLTTPAPFPSGDTQLVSGGFLSVFAVDPASRPLLPLAYIASHGTTRKPHYFEIPDGTKALSVFCWRVSTAATIDPAAGGGGLELHMSTGRAPIRPHLQRSSGCFETLVNPKKHVLCSVSCLPRHQVDQRLRAVAENTDAADSANLSIQYYVNACNEWNQQETVGYAVALGAVAAGAVGKWNQIEYWDAALLYAVAAVNPVDEVRGWILAANNA